MAQETQYDEITGIGLKYPLQWGGGGDFAWNAGPPYVAEKMAVAVGTVCSSARSVGDLPFAMRFGCSVAAQRNRNLHRDDRDLAAFLAAEAIRQHVRHASLRTVATEADPTTKRLRLRVGWDMRTGGQADQVVRRGLEDRLEVL